MSHVVLTQTNGTITYNTHLQSLKLLLLLVLMFWLPKLLSQCKVIINNCKYNDVSFNSNSCEAYNIVVVKYKQYKQL